MWKVLLLGKKGKDQSVENAGKVDQKNRHRGGVGSRKKGEQNSFRLTFAGNLSSSSFLVLWGPLGKRERG